jgi:hypothetical protein
MKTIIIWTLYVLSGLIIMFCPLIFYQIKHQDLYLAFLLITFTLGTLWFLYGYMKINTYLNNPIQKKQKNTRYRLSDSRKILRLGKFSIYKHVNKEHD